MTTILTSLDEDLMQQEVENETYFLNEEELGGSPVSFEIALKDLPVDWLDVLPLAFEVERDSYDRIGEAISVTLTWWLESLENDGESIVLTYSPEVSEEHARMTASAAKTGSKINE